MEDFQKYLYGFISNKYDFQNMWREKLHTPTLNYYFKSVTVSDYLYSTMKHRRRQIGLL